MVEAILGGSIIEEYPDDHRALVCGRTTLMGSVELYLHVVCECGDPVYVDFVTAYIPDELQWEKPPTRRRKKRK